MRIERQMVGRDREIVLHRRTDDVPDAALEALDAATPRDPVMNDEKLCARLRRGLDRTDARIDRKGDRGNCLSV